MFLCQITDNLHIMSLFVVLLVSEQSERDTIRGVQIRAGAVYIYICMEVRVPY